MPRVNAPGVRRTVESADDIQRHRVLTITVDAYGHVDYDHAGMSPYEATTVADYVSHKIQLELDQAWGLEDPPR